MRNSLSKIYRIFFLTDLFGISYTCVVYSPVFIEQLNGRHCLVSSCAKNDQFTKYWHVPP